MRNFFGRRGKWLLLLSALLACAGLWALLRVPDLAQYIAPAPMETTAEEQSAPGALANILAAWEANQSALSGAKASALFSTQYGASFSAAPSGSATGTLTGVSGGYADVYPKYLRSGRWFSAQELREGAQVIVLDEQLAFSLFPSMREAQGTVTLGENEYKVIGVVRHARAAGDADDTGAYVPLRAQANARVQAQYLTLCAETDGQAGVARALEDAAKTVLGENGAFYNLTKEKMRWTMMARIVFLIFAFYALFGALGALNRAFARRAREAKSDLKRRYLRDILAGILGRALVFLLGYAAVCAGGYLLLRLTIGPMYTFTEWVPEVIVEWKDIAARVNGLLRENARATVYKTPEMAAVRVYGSLIRWGIVCFLCAGVLLQGKPRKKAKAKSDTQG